MPIALTMNEDMVKRAEGGAIVKALRKARYLDFLPAPGGLKPVSPEEDFLFPADSHRAAPFLGGG